MNCDVVELSEILELNIKDEEFERLEEKYPGADIFNPRDMAMITKDIVNGRRRTNKRVLNQEDQEDLMYSNSYRREDLQHENHGVIDSFAQAEAELLQAKIALSNILLSLSTNPENVDSALAGAEVLSEKAKVVEDAFINSKIGSPAAYLTSAKIRASSGSLIKASKDVVNAGKTKVYSMIPFTTVKVIAKNRTLSKSTAEVAGVISKFRADINNNNTIALFAGIEKFYNKFDKTLNKILSDIEYAQAIDALKSIDDVNQRVRKEIEIDTAMLHGISGVRSSMQSRYNSYGNNNNDIMNQIKSRTTDSGFRLAGAPVEENKTEEVKVEDRNKRTEETVDSLVNIANTIQNKKEVKKLDYNNQKQALMLYSVMELLKDISNNIGLKYSNISDDLSGHIKDVSVEVANNGFVVIADNLNATRDNLTKLIQIQSPVDQVYKDTLNIVEQLLDRLPSNPNKVSEFRFQLRMSKDSELKGIFNYAIDAIYEVLCHYMNYLAAPINFTFNGEIMDFEQNHIKDLIPYSSVKISSVFDIMVNNQLSPVYKKVVLACNGNYYWHLKGTLFAVLDKDDIKLNIPVQFSLSKQEWLDDYVNTDFNGVKPKGVEPKVDMSNIERIRYDSTNMMHKKFFKNLCVNANNEIKLQGISTANSTLRNNDIKEALSDLISSLKSSDSNDTIVKFSYIYAFKNIADIFEFDDEMTERVNEIIPKIVDGLTEDETNTLISEISKCYSSLGGL